VTTNAVKHGALSSPEGRLAVRWSLVDGSEDDRGVLPYQLGAETSCELTPEGVRCTITLLISTTHREAQDA
jgi:two-component sensor histidine kinase